MMGLNPFGKSTALAKHIPAYNAQKRKFGFLRNAFNFVGMGKSSYLKIFPAK